MLHTVAISAAPYLFYFILEKAPYLFLCSETSAGFQILQIYKGVIQDLLPDITGQKLANQVLIKQMIH
jgi:hypothetical protein